MAGIKICDNKRAFKLTDSNISFKVSETVTKEHAGLGTYRYTYNKRIKLNLIS